MDEQRDESMSAWNNVEHCWPITGSSGSSTYAGLQQDTQELLGDTGIDAESFSHFGLVVSSISRSLEALGSCPGMHLGEVSYAAVEAYGVNLARLALEGQELELIQPSKASRFQGHLRDHGEGLHHIGFIVEDIYFGLQRLKLAGVQLIDEEPRTGAHGKIVFARPKSLAPYQLELCQPQS